MSGYMSDKYNTRYMNVIAAAVCALCYIAAYLAPNLDITIMSFACLGKESTRIFRRRPNAIIIYRDHHNILTNAVILTISIIIIVIVARKPTNSIHVGIW